jgi:hypothetical protein
MKLAFFFYLLSFLLSFGWAVYTPFNDLRVIFIVLVVFNSIRLWSLRDIFSE